MSERRPDDLGFALPEPARLSRARAVALFGAASLVLGGAFLAAWLPRRHAQAELAAETKAAGAAKPRVEVVTPKLASSDRALVLPGSIQPLEQTTIYARASGYVRKWNRDIGDKVKEGELLAELDTPEVDRQLDEAKAQLTRAEAGLTQAEANLALSKQNLERVRKMVANGVASQQELDQRTTQAQVDQANRTVAVAAVDAEKANVRRLSQLKSYARIVAPFAGTVTTRSVERGALVTAGNATPLYIIAATDPVRVFVQVPQEVAPSVRTELTAHVTVREFPGRSFDGTVAHAAGALDPATRTMTTEVRVPNPKGELLTGMYAQVSIVLPIPHRVVELPATAVMEDDKGVRVATVSADDRIALRRIVVERDTGPTVQIASGLDGTERVVLLANADLTEGRPVDFVP